MDYVSSNAKSSLFGAVLYIFEYNEAVIKLIINGRSPTMRHVSRTHRVALDWLFGRINLDPKIQIGYIASLMSCTQKMAKGEQEQKEEEIIVAKSRRTAIVNSTPHTSHFLVQ